MGRGSKEEREMDMERAHERKTEIEYYKRVDIDLNLGDKFLVYRLSICSNFKF